MANHLNNSNPGTPSAEADSPVQENADAARETGDMSRAKVRKKIPIKNPVTRVKHRSKRYETLRRSQRQLGWCIAIATLVGIGCGLFFGKLAIAVGAAAGLTVGLAAGLIISS